MYAVGLLDSAGWAEKAGLMGCGFNCDADDVAMGIRTAPAVLVDGARAVAVVGGATLLGTRTAPDDAKFVFCATSNTCPYQQKDADILIRNITGLHSLWQELTGA